MKRKWSDYVLGTNWLTKQERRVLICALALLLTGWAVKYYRMAHPPAVSVEEAKQ